MQQPRTLWRWISFSPFLHYRLQSVVHLTLVSGSGCHSGPPTGEQVCLSTPNPTDIPDQVFKTNLSSSTNQLSFDHNKSASSGQHWQSIQGLFCLWSKPSTSRNPGEPSPSYPQTYFSGLLHDQQGQRWVPPGLWSWLCHLWSISRALHVPAILAHPSPFPPLLSRRSEATVLSCEPSVVLITGGDQASLACPLHSTLMLLLQAMQQVEVYSSSTNSCRLSLPSLHGLFSDHTLDYVDGNVLLCGGSTYCVLALKSNFSPLRCFLDSTLQRICVSPSCQTSLGLPIPTWPQAEPTKPAQFIGWHRRIQHSQMMMNDAF